MFVQCLKWQQHGYLGPQSFYLFDGGSRQDINSISSFYQMPLFQKFLEEIALIGK